jgi:hypothetical protein
MLCDAPGYVESGVGGATVPAGSRAKGELCKELILSMASTHTHLSAR